MIPSTAEESVVEISTLDQLKTFRDNVNSGVSADASVKLTANINLNNEEWTPIGSDDTKPFKGKFDGQGYTISGLYISADKDYQGLFGFVSGDKAEISNLTVSGKVVADEYVGIIAGVLKKGAIKNCASDGSVSAIKSGTVDYDVYAASGGVVGYNEGGTVSNCTATGRVCVSDIDGGTGKYVYADSGGVTGYNNSAGTVKNCAASCGVSTINSGDASVADSLVFAGSGGIAGSNYGTVENCTATGDVSASNSGTGIHNVYAYSGGGVGYNDGTVKNCATTGEVSASGSGNGSYVNTSSGGVVGNNGGTVENCRATGDVSASGSGNGTNVFANSGGGVAGYNGGTVKNCTATGKVSASNSGTGAHVFANSGGVAGDNNGAGTVKNCAATGKGEVSASGSSVKYVGGVVGRNYYNYSSVMNCAATGSVSGDADTTGGVAGYNYGKVWNCGWLKNGVNVSIGSADKAAVDAVSFDSAEKIAVACLPDPMSITVANGASKKVTLKAWPAGVELAAKNYDSITAAVSPDATIASATVNGAVATVTGKKLGTGAVNFTFSLKPTHFTGDCSGVSTDVSLTPSAVLTVKDAAGFTISPTALSLGINGTGTITASETASWTVSDGTIAKISAETGESVTVTGLAAGTTTITATNELGESATCEVTVTTSGGGGSSGGGCSTGLGTLALLALMPLAWRRKK